jgi:cytochrome c-type biogenesis protein
MIAFGTGYALASASCTLAVLLSVVTQALATTNFSGVLVMFGAYAAGSATLLLTLAVFAAFASGLISRFLRRLLPHMHRITGAVLALSGGYLLLYWLPQLTGSGPGSNALAGLVGGLAAWINTHQLLIAAIALTLIAAVALAAYAQRPRCATAHEGADSVEDCCARATAPSPRSIRPENTAAPERASARVHDRESRSRRCRGAPAGIHQRRSAGILLGRNPTLRRCERHPVHKR